jgi:hypothetical protein
MHNLIEIVNRKYVRVHLKFICFLPLLSYDEPHEMASQLHRYERECELLRWHIDQCNSQSNGDAASISVHTRYTALNSVQEYGVLL